MAHIPNKESVWPLSFMTLEVFELGTQKVHKKAILEKFRLGAKNVHKPPPFLITYVLKYKASWWEWIYKLLLRLQ